MAGALRDGELLYWDAMRNCGTAYWGAPNTAPFYPPLALAVLVLGPLGGLNATVLLHLAFGAWGTWRLARGFGAAPFAAFLAAALFLHATFTRLFAYELPFEALGLAFLPWVLHHVARVGRGHDWRVCGLAAGLLWALVPWCGAYIVLLYGFLAAGILGVVRALAPEHGRARGRELLRVVGALLLFVVVFLAVGAGRILPTLAWVRITERAGDLPYEATIAGVLFTPGELFGQLGKESWLAVALCLVAVGAALARRVRGALPFALVFGLVCVLTLGWGHRFLYDYVPGFDKVRDPRRAWVLVAVTLPVLAALGLRALAGALPAKWTSGPVAWVAGALLVVLIGLDSARGWQRPELHSLSARLEANALHQDLARRAAEETRFRVLDAKDTRAKLKRTADLIRASLDLESVEGVLGNISILAYDQDFVVPGRGSPRVWGYMNCRYVTSAEPLDDPLLELVGTFEEDPDELNPGTDGPYLYRNRFELPRAYLADTAVLLLDANPGVRKIMLKSGNWNPRRSVVLRAASARAEGLSDDALRGVDSWLSFVDSPRSSALAERVRGLGGRWIAMGQGRGPGSLPRNELFPRGTSQIRALPDPERGWNSLRVSLGNVDAPTWLVLAETCAIYPGWRAEVDGVETPLLVANGVATAIPVPAGAREVRLEYLPERLPLGIFVTAVGTAAAAASLLLLRKKRVS